MIDGTPEESRRRTELTRYACHCQLFSVPALTNAPRSALEEIGGRSQELLAKGKAARLLDKAADSREVARLIELLRGAITNYRVGVDCLVAPSTTHTEEQISQQQAIYDRITDLIVGAFRCISILYTDDQFSHRVFFRYPLKTSRGDVVH